MSMEELAGLIRFYAEMYGITTEEAVKRMTDEMKNGPRQRTEEKLSMEPF